MDNESFGSGSYNLSTIPVLLANVGAIFTSSLFFFPNNHPPIPWHTHVPLSYFSTLVHYKYLYSFSTIFVQFFCSSENAYNVIYILYVHFSSTMCQVIIWFWGYNNE